MQHVSDQARTPRAPPIAEDESMNVKFFRANGQVHYCGHLSQSEPVSLDTPDLCFH
jgi:hypothetical protein